MGNMESWWNYMYYHRGGERGQMYYYPDLILPEALFMNMRVPSNHQTISRNIYLELAFMRVLYPGLVQVEFGGRKTGESGENPSDRATLVEDERSRHCTIPASLDSAELPYLLPTISWVTIPAPYFISFCNLLNFSRLKRISKQVMQSTFITSVKSSNLNYLSSQQVRWRVG